MQLVCPSCRATYEVPDDRLGTGARRLRCAVCAHEWSFVPPLPPLEEPPPPPLEPFSAPPLVVEPRTPPVPAFPPREAPPSFAWGALAAWAASILLLIGLGFAAVNFRAEIMQVWPPVQRLYAVFGVGPH